MIFCKFPYTSCEIHSDGSVYPCCRPWCKEYSFGNILEKSLEEIWNSKKAQLFREQFNKNDYTYCSMDICQPVHINFNEENPLNSKFPRIIKLVYDNRCNLQCVFCRPRKITQFKDKEEEVNATLRKLLPIFNEKCTTIYLNGAGEVFCNSFLLDFIKEVTQNYPNINFDIITNGTLATKEKFEELKLENRVRNVEVSIHSTREKTYNKLINGGNYKNVMKNIKYMSQLLKEGKIENLFLNYVVTSENYKEMKDFVKFAKKIDAYVIFLPLIQQYGISDEYYNHLNIMNPHHPQYHQFYKLMQDPIFRSGKTCHSTRHLNLKSH